MDGYNFGEFFDRGAQHDVYDNGGGELIKKPNDTCTYTLSQAQRALDFSHDRFSNFAIDTEVKPHGDRYIIVQEKIDGKILRDTDFSMLDKEILSSIQEVLSIHGDILDESKSNFDVIGFQPFHHNKPGSSADFGSNIEYLSKKAIFLGKVLVTDILKSSNFMIDDKGKLVLIDDVYVDAGDEDELYRKLPLWEFCARKSWSELNKFGISAIKKTR